MYFVPDDTKTAFGYRDVFMLELPRLVHQHCDITSKFMDTFDFGRFQQLNQISVIGFVPDSKVMVRQYFGSDSKADDSEFSIGTGEEAVKVRTLFKYNVQTVSGDCGAVLVAFDKNFHNKIFGIHCAGLDDPHYQGYGTPVTRNFLKHMEDNISCLYSESRMAPALPVHNDRLPLEVNTCINGRNIWTCTPELEGNFYPIGRDSKRLFQNRKSKIVPSPVHGVIQEPTMAPAALGPRKDLNGQLIDPMANARKKASPISPPMNLDLLDECANNYLQFIERDSRDKRVLSYSEGISGVEGDDCYPPMKRTTSPGYGWEKKGVGKQQWLGSDEYIYDHPALIAKHAELLATCKRGERPNTIWCDTLKDERRSMEKIDAVKTRLFSCGEMAFTILFRQYFGGFCAHMTRNKIAVESCVGTDVYSMDWNRIATTLKQVGDKYAAGDFSNYDGTLHPDILWRICDLINQWYGGTAVETLIRIALWSEIVNSIHLIDDIFYMWNHSQPSGCPLTVVINCVYHSIAARYVYMLCALAKAPEYATLAWYHKLIRHLNYGDDDIWGLSDKVVAWFNQVEMTAAFLKIGMIYTDESKSSDVVPYRSLDEINFLKREFRWDVAQCRYRAPLSLVTIREMAMWNNGTVDQYIVTANVLETAVRELAQHSEEVFNRELPDFERAAAVLRLRTPVMFKTYRQYQFDEVQKIYN
jgi:hypothetical protein